MRVLVDTNILMSAIWRKGSKIGNILKLIARDGNFTIVLTDQNIREFKVAVDRKMPDRAQFIEPLLSSLAYNLIPAVDVDDTPSMRDIKDQPILNAAIKNDIDIILTGDKDFLSLELEHPRCMTAAEFFEEFYNG